MMWDVVGVRASRPQHIATGGSQSIGGREVLRDRLPTLPATTGGAAQHPVALPTRLGVGATARTAANEDVVLDAATGRHRTSGKPGA